MFHSGILDHCLLWSAFNAYFALVIHNIRKKIKAEDGSESEQIK